MSVRDLATQINNRQLATTATTTTTLNALFAATNLQVNTMANSHAKVANLSLNVQLGAI